MMQFHSTHPARLLSGLLLGLTTLVSAPSANAQPTIAAATAAVTTVWAYSPTCTPQDYPDVPARPFLVAAPAGSTVLWFAANSNGAYAGVGMGTSPDILAKLQRGTAAGAGCVSWLPAASYAGSTPSTYNSGLWMVAPFTADGTNIQALIHNEFHGEWTGDTSWCWQQTSIIYLPCSYWNIVSAASVDAGVGFQLRQQAAAPGTNVPAIALGDPYQPPSSLRPTNLPQGMTAQSNILQSGDYYYVLVQQLPFQPSGTTPSPQNGVCIYRAPVPTSPGQPLAWSGWGGSGYTVTVPASYPAGASLPLCQPVLDAPFRFSWSINTVLGQLILIGQDTLTAMEKHGVTLDGCPYAPGATTTTADEAFVYMTAILDQATGTLSPTSQEACLLQINSIANWQADTTRTGHAYPSLLDPTSPQLMAGDRNFQYSGALPFLYFTQLNPVGPGNPHGFDRDLVRMPLAVSLLAGAK